MVTKVKEKDFWSEKIPFIKKLKDFYSKIEYKGINLWPVMANDVYTYYKGQENRTNREIFLETIKNFFLLDKFKVRGGKNRVLASYLMPREDHHELFLKSISYFKKNELSLMDFYVEKIKNPLKRSLIKIPNIFLLLSIINKFNKSWLKKILGRYYWLFISKTYLRYKQINQFYSLYKKYIPQGYIAFCSSAFPEEAILTLICKKNQIPTFTLQHGFLSNYSSNFTTFIIQSENILSDYLLLWGKSSYDIQNRFVDKARLLIVGNPKYSPSKKIQKEFDPKNATIFFSVKGHEESNKKMIKILNEFAIKHSEINFKIKLHPFDNIKNYSGLVNSKNMVFVNKEASVKELLEKSDFIIVHSTSIAYEALIYKIPLFRFKDEFFSDIWKNSDTFSNLDKLEKLFSRLKNKKIFRKFMKFYYKKIREIFYFHPKKSVPKVYYEKIIEIVNKNKIPR